MEHKCLPFFLLATQILQALAQVYPTQFAVPSEARSINGSSATGHCSTVTGTTSTCEDPTSSVLFDGVIPTLTGLDGDTWASQLLTLETGESTTEISFDFTATTNHVRVERIEVVMFNCPEWEVSASTIIVSGADSTTDPMSQLYVYNTPPTSCSSLVRVCMPVTTTRKVLGLQFAAARDTNWVHLAEVTFYGGSASCQQADMVTPSLPPTITTTISDTASGPTELQESSESEENDSTVPATEISTPIPNGPTPNGETQREACPSCSKYATLASVSAAIVTALLATVIFALVQIAVCAHFLKKIKILQRTAPEVKGDVRVYAQVENNPWSSLPRGETATNPTYNLTNETADHTYTEIEHRSEITFKDNEAYASFTRSPYLTP